MHINSTYSIGGSYNTILSWDPIMKFTMLKFWTVDLV